MDLFERMFRATIQGLEDYRFGSYWDAYPRMGEIKRYKVVPMTEDDIVKEKIARLEWQVEIKKQARAEYDKQVAELQEELEKQKKRLNP
jgi:hypothetical protein